eukprot:SAG31_NODE_15593_length_747_cov_1.939815_1_plen_107_part_00
MQHLTIQRPVRDADDAAYSAFASSLGNGTATPCPNINGIGMRNDGALVYLPSFVLHTLDFQSLIDFVYPDKDALLSDPRRYSKRAILCSTNRRVNEFGRSGTESMR